MLKQYTVAHESVYAERHIKTYYGKYQNFKMNKNSLNIRQQDHVTYMENEDKIIRILNSNGLYLKKMQGRAKVGSQF